MTPTEPLAEPSSPGRDWSRIALGAVSGLVAAIVALGVAELIAGLGRSWRSPVLDVGDRVVDGVPSSVKDLAIEWFGTNDKIALLVGIGVLLAVYAAIVGVVAFTRSLRVGLVGIALFGVVGVWAVLSRRVGGDAAATIPTLLGTLSGAGSLWLLHRLLLPSPARSGSETDRAETPDTARSGSETDRAATLDEAPVQRSDSDPERAGTDRRTVLVRGGAALAGLTLFGVTAGAVGRAIRTRFSASESRAAVVLPRARRVLPSAPTGVEVDVAGMQPFFTPNADFYRIDTALTVPQVPTDGWELRVTGLVDRELSLDFEELLARGVDEYDITLSCVSNTIGGELVGTARWLGVRLDDLLRDAGVSDRADQVVGRSVDGYTCGFPLEAAMDGRDAIIAVGMNGEPLPLEHGFPARLVTPGLYGYVSATKWLTEIELTRFDEFEQYWVPRGYAEQAPIKLMSRIDSVDGLDDLDRNADGVAAIGGVAWAQTRGIAGVEVQIDDGPWEPAELGESLGDDTWRQWAYRWEPAAEGRTSIRCRAIDRNGVIQTAERSEPLPAGASGHHQVVVFIR